MLSRHSLQCPCTRTSGKLSLMENWNMCKPSFLLCSKLQFSEGEWVNNISHTYMYLFSVAFWTHSLEWVSFWSCSFFVWQGSCEITGGKQFTRWISLCQCSKSASHTNGCGGPVGFSSLPASQCVLFGFSEFLVHSDRTLSSSLSALFSGSGAGLFSHPDKNVWLIGWSSQGFWQAGGGRWEIWAYRVGISLNRSI